jgi:hypothetical protein
VAFPACAISGAAGPPTFYGEQASHDYSWFGFIELLYLLIIKLANAMPI